MKWRKDSSVAFERTGNGSGKPAPPQDVAPPPPPVEPGDRNGGGAGSLAAGGGAGTGGLGTGGAAGAVELRGWPERGDGIAGGRGAMGTGAGRGRGGNAQEHDRPSWLEEQDEIWIDEVPKTAAPVLRGGRTKP